MQIILSLSGGVQLEGFDQHSGLNMDRDSQLRAVHGEWLRMPTFLELRSYGLIKKKPTKPPLVPGPLAL